MTLVDVKQQVWMRIDHAVLCPRCLEQASFLQYKDDSTWRRLSISLLSLGRTLLAQYPGRTVRARVVCEGCSAGLSLRVVDRRQEMGNPVCSVAHG